MARINVEDIWFLDPRRDSLLAEIGEAVDFVALRMWRLAQDFYQSGRQIPKELYYRVPHAKAFLEAGLAEDRGDEIYIKGSNSHFEWIQKRRDAGRVGGRLSALRPRDKKGRLLPKEPQADPSDVQANPSKPKRIQASSSSSAAVTSAEDLRDPDPNLNQNPNTTLRVQEIAPATSVEPKKQGKFTENTRAKMRAFLGAYANGWKTKYGGSPEGVRDKAVIGKLGHWIESVSEEHACALIQIYLQIDYRAFTENFHDLWQFFRHLNRIGVAYQTGRSEQEPDWSRIFGRDAA